MHGIVLLHSSTALQSVTVCHGEQTRSMVWRKWAASDHQLRLTACCPLAIAAVLKDAADTVEENGIQGSSTCCLVLVDTLQGRLTSANVGDSGFLLIGERRLVRPLPEQVPSRRRFTAQCSAYTTTVQSAVLIETAPRALSCTKSGCCIAVPVEADCICGTAGSSQTNRKPHVKFHAPQQEHTFGFPYQVRVSPVVAIASCIFMTHVVGQGIGQLRMSAVSFPMTFC